MRLLCIFRGHRHQILREDWLEPAAKGKTVRHLQFLRCSHCFQTLAMITSPEYEETKWSKPTEHNNASLMEILEGAKS